MKELATKKLDHKKPSSTIELITLTANPNFFFVLAPFVV